MSTHHQDRPQPDDQGQAKTLETLYQQHLEREGDQAWNQHPDGCWYCGNTEHHTTECHNRTPGDEQ